MANDFYVCHMWKMANGFFKKNLDDRRKMCICKAQHSYPCTHVHVNLSHDYVISASVIGLT